MIFKNKQPRYLAVDLGNVSMEQNCTKQQNTGIWWHTSVIPAPKKQSKGIMN